MRFMYAIFYAFGRIELLESINIFSTVEDNLTIDIQMEKQL